MADAESLSPPSSRSSSALVFSSRFSASRQQRGFLLSRGEVLGALLRSRSSSQNFRRRKCADYPLQVEAPPPREASFQGLCQPLPRSVHDGLEARPEQTPALQGGGTAAEGRDASSRGDSGAALRDSFPLLHSQHPTCTRQTPSEEEPLLDLLEEGVVLRGVVEALLAKLAVRETSLASGQVSGLAEGLEARLLVSHFLLRRREAGRALLQRRLSPEAEEKVLALALLEVLVLTATQLSEEGRAISKRANLIDCPYIAACGAEAARVGSEMICTLKRIGCRSVAGVSSTGAELTQARRALLSSCRMMHDKGERQTAFRMLEAAASLLPRLSKATLEAFPTELATVRPCTERPWPQRPPS